MQKFIIERAFELAESGEYRGIEAIRRQLLNEDYDQVDLHLAGAFTRRQLLDILVAARERRAPGHPLRRAPPQGGRT